MVNAATADTRERLIDASLFVDGSTGERSLAGSVCLDCATVTFPAQASCPKCTGTDVERSPLPTTGRLWAYTVQRFAPKPPFLGADGRTFTPYVVGYVNLDDRVLVESRVVGVDPEGLSVDMPLELTLEPIHEDADGIVLTFAFAPSTTVEGAS